MSYLSLSEDNNSSRRMQGKRSLANLEACKHDLSNEIRLLFATFSDALSATQTALQSFPPNFRSKTLEADIMQSYFAEYLNKYFGNRAFYGKYRRLILNLTDYIVLFKKLDRKGFPMNIKTLNVQSILSQQQSLDLFAGTNYNDEPILYFGYQKDRMNAYVNPQLIYIDEGEIKFSITKNDMGDGMNPLPSPEVMPSGPQPTPTLKEIVIKKAE